MKATAGYDYANTSFAIGAKAGDADETSLMVKSEIAFAENLTDETATLTLMYSNSQSCGCKKLENNQKMQEQLIHVAGTGIDMLKSKNVPKNSSTGIRGVYRVKTRYIAKIVFQGRQYQLGTYGRIEDTAQARREAEISLSEAFVACYEKRHACAEDNPEWAERNPIRASVQRINGELRLALTSPI